MNISIPEDLKARMDAVTGVVWSRVAAEAFDREVKSRTLEGTDMTAVVERLKASRAKVEKTQREEGVDAGKDWAKSDAQWDELCEVAKIDETTKHASDLYWRVVDEYGYDEESLFGHKDVTAAKVAGFIVGARSVKEAVDAAG